MSFPWFRLRSPLYDDIFVSPHMDDAVYSCGGRIAQRRAEGATVLVVTVFGNGANADAGKGVFGDMETRKLEEREAMHLLDVDHLWLNLPDLLVREKNARDLMRYAVPFATLGPNALQLSLFSSLSALRARMLARGGRLYFPLGVGAHPDHRLVFEVGCSLASERDVWFYEDVPYANVPSLRYQRLSELRLTPSRLRWRAPGEIHDFVFAHAPAWQQPFTRGAVLGHWAFTQALARVTTGVRVKQRAYVERDISDAVERKLQAMRAYGTQTEYFWPGQSNEAISAQLAQVEGRHVERSWQLDCQRGPLIDPEPAQLARELARVDELLDLLNSRGPGRLGRGSGPG